MVSPWNGGSGFHPKDNVDGIRAVEMSTTDRLVEFREVIKTAQGLVADPRWPDLTKDERVQWCRNVLVDDAVLWLDAAVVLSEAGAVFPPILGTGGNVGRLDFSNNFMQQVSNVLTIRQGRGAPRREDSVAWLRAALGGGAATVKLLKKAVGQFDPGAAGGTNAPAGGVEESLVNPWDFVLTFEGALLFASGAARRMGAEARSKAAMPFTFDTSPIGYPTAVDGENAKGELWAPLWSRAAPLAEVVRLLGEGRAEWNGGHARRGIDAVRAATSLGVDRGISGFVRHAFVERMGQAMLAVPVGRVGAAEGQRDDVPALAELDGWVERVRRAKNLPAGPSTTLRRLDNAMFELATDGGARRLQDVLVVVAELERAVARSRTLRAQVTEPFGNPDRRPAATGEPMLLESYRWLPLLEDGSSEFRLAAALASGRDRPPPSNPDGNGLGAQRPVGPASGDRRDTPATLLRGISVLPGRGRRLAWRPEGRPVVAGLGIDSLVEVLGVLVQRRAIEVGARRDDDSIGEVQGQVGIDPGYPLSIPAPVEDVVGFTGGRVDDVGLARLLSALLLLRFRGQVTFRKAPEHTGPAVHTPGAVALVLPFFHGRKFQPVGAPTPVRLRAAPAWPRLLGADRVEEVVADALHRLRVARFDPLVADVRSLARGVSGPRLLAATAFPLSDRGVTSLLHRVVAPGDDLLPTNDPQGEI
jgi:CRISPR-associated protein Csx17